MFERAGVMDKGEEEIVIIGLNRLSNIILDGIFAIICAGLMGNVVVGIIFELNYIVLRIYAGGYHAKNKIRCFFLTYVSTFICIILIFVIPINKNIMEVTLIILFLVIAVTTPIYNENKPLNKMEMMVYRRKSVCIAFIEIVICFFLLLFDLDVYARAIYVSILLVVCGIFTELIKKYHI